jgi:hypothetical protein
LDCRGRAEKPAEAFRDRWRGRLGVDGISDFDALLSGRDDEEV